MPEDASREIECHERFDVCQDEATRIRNEKVRDLLFRHYELNEIDMNEFRALHAMSEEEYAARRAVCLQEFCECRGRDCPEERERNPKANIAKLSSDFWIGGEAAGVAAAVIVSRMGQPQVATATLIVSVSTGMLGFVAATLSRLAADPPDRRFAVVAKPKKKVVRVKRGAASRSTVSAVNALLENSAEIIAQARALSTAVDRAGGARRARDGDAQRRQMKAASRYALALGSALSEAAMLRLRVVAAVSEDGPGALLSKREMASARARIRRDGFPKQIGRSFAAIGIEAAERKTLLAELKRRLARVKLQGRRFPDFIAAASGAKLDDRTELALYRFASRA